MPRVVHGVVVHLLTRRVRPLLSSLTQPLPEGEEYSSGGRRCEFSASPLPLNYLTVAIRTVRKMGGQDRRNARLCRGIGPLAGAD